MNPYLEKLNPEQYAAATHMDGPLLIIAGAGSGKTHTLIGRVINLVEHDVAPESILLLTFTNKAADEMKSRAVAASDKRCGKIMACTYHSFCAAMLRRYAEHIGYKRNFTILSSPEMEDAIKFVKAKAGDKYKKLRGFPPTKAIASIISGAVNTMRTIPDYMRETASKYEGFSLEVEQIAKGYTVYKRERNMMDFDDLLVQFAKLLETDERARKQISDTYRYIMVDEYQDTNALQEKIVMLLRKDCDNLAVVGDDAQSIYAFRGADINIILSFKDKMPGCETVNLVTNYRSNDEIVQLSNQSINIHKVKGFDKHMHGTYEAGRKPVVIRTDNENEESSTVFNMIKTFHRQGVEFRDMAVMARSSSSMYRLESLLTEDGISYEKYGGLKFLEHTCIRDVLAYIRCLTNPSDQLSWFRVMKLHPGIGDTYAGRVSEDCVTSRRFLTGSKHIKKSFKDELLLLSNFMEEAAGLEFKEQLDKTIKFYLALRKRCISIADLEDESTRTNMVHELEEDKQTLSLLPTITEKYKTAAAFLDAITLDVTVNPNSGGADPLVLTTIHSAKGLEWKIVFILSCMDGLFPHECMPGSDEEGEELRCFYVAMTRAKENLYIMVPSSAIINGKYTRGYQTRFLDECEDFYRDQY